jgi:carbon monoxide dehydrogenase subunit G
LTVPISASIEVERPPAEAFSYVTNPSCFVEWQRGVVSAHMESDEPAAVGDRCLTVRRIGVAKRLVTSEVVNVEPPRSWGIRGIDGPIRAAVNVTVQSLDDGLRSRVTVAIDFTGHGIGTVLVPLLVRRQARKEMPANLARLKERLETRDLRDASS